MLLLRLFLSCAVLLLLAGCSRSAPAAVNPTGAFAAKKAVASPQREVELPSDPLPTLPAQPVEPGRRGTESESDSTPPPTIDMGDLFAPPKAAPPVVTKQREIPRPVQPVPAEVPKKEDPVPPIRLIGFADMDGLRAIVSLDGKLHVLAAGESVDGTQITALEPPLVTLRHRTGEFQIDLMQQPWQDNTHGALAPKRPAAPRPQRRSPTLPAAHRAARPTVPATPPPPKYSDNPKLPAWEPPPARGSGTSRVTSPAAPPALRDILKSLPVPQGIPPRSAN